MSDYKKVCTIYGIAFAMEIIHAFDIIHRDLKPKKNILIDVNGHLKVSDFGFKCYMDVENKAQSKTAGVSILKLVEPELLNESKHYTNKVDVYSFDVVVKLPKISVIEQGNGKKATIPKKNVNKISHNLISK